MIGAFAGYKNSARKLSASGTSPTWLLKRRVTNINVPVGWRMSNTNKLKASRRSGAGVHRKIAI
jgi:hypothetical protein